MTKDSFKITQLLKKLTKEKDALSKLLSRKFKTTFEASFKTKLGDAKKNQQKYAIQRKQILTKLKQDALISMQIKKLLALKKRIQNVEKIKKTLSFKKIPATRKINQQQRSLSRLLRKSLRKSKTELQTSLQNAGAKPGLGFMRWIRSKINKSTAADKGFYLLNKLRNFEKNLQTQKTNGRKFIPSAEHEAISSLIQEVSNQKFSITQEHVQQISKNTQKFVEKANASMKKAQKSFYKQYRESKRQQKKSSKILSAIIEECEPKEILYKSSQLHHPSLPRKAPSSQSRRRN